MLLLLLIVTDLSLAAPTRAVAQGAWTPTSLAGAPTGRTEHTAVWTGTKMVVWGGFDGASYTNTGAVYFDPAVLPPADFYTVTPCRVVDTREPDGPTLGAPITCGTEERFTVAGRCGVPSSAQAVSLNLTGTGSTAPGNVRLYPAGAPAPLVSTLNYVAGQTRANNAVASLGAGGKISVLCSPAGTTHVILDVNGYFGEAPSNLAPNPSFELGSLGPTDWSWILGGATYEWKLGDARTGTRSVCIGEVQANHSNEWNSSALSVVPGRVYRIGAWAKGSSAVEADVGVWLKNASGSWLTGYSVRIPYNASSWTFRETTFTAPAEAASMGARVMVNNPGDDAPDQVCFDDVILEDVTPP